MIYHICIQMVSQTPITDEIQRYGVLDAESLQSMRNRELSGDLTSVDAEPILIQCREIAMTNADLKLENIEIADSMVSFISADTEQGKKNLYNTIENAEKDDEQKEQNVLMDSLLKN